VTRTPVEQLPASKAPSRPVWVNSSLVVAALASGAAAYFALPASMDEPARRMAAIFVVALVLWVSEAVPLFATSMLVIAGEAWWLTLQTGWERPIAYTDIYASLGSPIIFLFLGGFILARGVQKEGIDVQLAAALMRPFGKHPGGVLAGVMFITALFSMFMSNTATTAMMIVLVQPLALQVPAGDRFRRGLVLAVPFAANVGGIGTPIGTPPNAIALEALRARGLEINFFEWMAFALPLLVGTLAVMWLLLFILYRPGHEGLRVEVKSEFKLTLKALVVYMTFAVTLALWLGSPWLDQFFGLNLPTAVVAVVPAAVLTATKVISRKDFNSLEWDVLVLIAGGIALGKGMGLTGLDAWLVESLPTSQMSFFMLVASCCLFVVALGTVMSHTVATTIVMPLAIAVASGVASEPQVQVLAVMVAIASSYAVALPISTPPNAIAYGSDLVDTRDIMRVGILTCVVATVIIITTGPAVVSLILRVVG